MTYSNMENSNMENSNTENSNTENSVFGLCIHHNHPDHCTFCAEGRLNAAVREAEELAKSTPNPFIVKTYDSPKALEDGLNKHIFKGYGVLKVDYMQHSDTFYVIFQHEYSTFQITPPLTEA